MAEELTKESEGQNWYFVHLNLELAEAWLSDAIYYLEQERKYLLKALGNLAELRGKLKGED